MEEASMKILQRGREAGNAHLDPRPGQGECLARCGQPIGSGGEAAGQHN